MTRLDHFIRRLEAQRNCLNAVLALIAGIGAPVLELGLGNGRTYDHLRHLFPNREIFVFERQPAPHPASRPDPEHLVVGDLEDTLPGASGFLPTPAALVHSDIGTHDRARDERLARWLARTLPPITRPGALLASDRRLDDDALASLPLCAAVSRGYFVYRRAP